MTGDSVVSVSDERATPEVILGRFLDQFTVGARARGLSCVAFPHRRRDEAGWCLGHIVAGVVLIDQLNFVLPCDDHSLTREHRVRSLLDRLALDRPVVS